MDPSPADTSAYLIRYKIKDIDNVPWSTIQRDRPALKKSVVYITINKLKPYTVYLIEISPKYKDGDVGPYSLPLVFNTDEGGE